MEILVDYDPRYASIEHIRVEKVPLYEAVAEDARMVNVQQIAEEGDVLILQSKHLGCKVVGQATGMAAMKVEDGHVALQIASFNAASRENFFEQLGKIEDAV